MNKKFKVIITIFLFIFSFYYTDKCVTLLKKKDPLMEEIRNKSKLYNIDPIDAIITNNTIIPGSNGLVVNELKSYDKMKKLGTFNETLLVYDEVNPSLSYKDYYDKIIVSNNKNNKLSLIFNIKDISVYKEIKNILNKYDIKGNYYFKNSFLTNNINEIKNIEDTILVNNLINIKKYSELIDYCLVYEVSNQIPCKNHNKHTILSSINIDNYHLTYTKNNFKNNNILTYSFNKNNIKDLEIIINYLLNNNLEIVSITELLKE